MPTTVLTRATTENWRTTSSRGDYSIPFALSCETMEQVSANNVRAELAVAVSLPLVRSMPFGDAETAKEAAFHVGPASSIDDFTSARGKPGEVTIDKNDERIRLEIDCGAFNRADEFGLR